MSRGITIVLLVCAAFFSAPAAQQDLTSADIQKIKRVCKSWVGRQWYYPPESFRRELMAYSRSADMLSKAYLICSANNCGSTFLLRGKADIYYRFANEHPGLSENGPINTVAFHIRRKPVLVVGPIEGDPNYPYPKEQPPPKTEFIRTTFCLGSDGTMLYIVYPSPNPHNDGHHRDFFDDRKRIRATVYYRNDATSSKKMLKELDASGDVVLKQEFDTAGKVTKEQSTKPHRFGTPAIVSCL